MGVASQVTNNSTRVAFRQVKIEFSIRRLCGSISWWNVCYYQDLGMVEGVLLLGPWELEHVVGVIQSISATSNQFSDG